MDQFWLTDEQFARIAPHLPTDTRGKERVDDRRVISGIIHVLKSGGRWTDAPRDVYGPKKTRLTTASCAGRPRGSGSGCPRPWPSPAGRPPRC
jgi:transposase